MPTEREDDQSSDTEPRITKRGLRWSARCLFRSSRAVLPLSRPDDIPKGNAGDHDVANAITVVTESFMTAARRLAD